MSDLAISFASLVKYNGGLFKSEKQAKFLLSQCRGRVFYVSGNIGRSYFYLLYTCDSKGVVTVQKETSKGIVLTWERKEAGKIAVQDKEEISSLKKSLKRAKEGYEQMKSYAWADPEMGKQHMADKENHIKTIIDRLVKLEAI